MPDVCTVVMDCVLLDLPRPFLRQLLCECDFDAVFALACTSKTAFQTVLDHRPATLAVWSTAKPSKLQQLLPLGGVQALLLPDSHRDEPFSPEELQGLSGLRSAALSYRLPNLVHSLLASPRTSHLNSIIICGGRKRDLRLLPDLSIFLYQLRGYTALQHLVLTLPCDVADLYELGQLSQLLSLRIASDTYPDLTLPRYPEVTFADPDDDSTKYLWDEDHWRLAVRPLWQLTSLQVQCDMVFNRKDNLQLESLSNLQRLELYFDQPQRLDLPTNLVPFHDSMSAASAAIFLEQPGFTRLQQLTRLVVTTQSPLISYFADMESAQEWNMVPNAVSAIAQLTNLCSLQLTPTGWSCTLQQLQQLSSCSRLSELVLNELALGFADSCALIDAHGTELTPDEQHIATAALQAAENLRRTTSTAPQCNGVSPHRHEPGQKCVSPGSPICGSTRTWAVSTAVSERALLEMDTAGNTCHHSDVSGCSGQAAAAVLYPTVVKVRSGALQVPLLPGLEVLRVTSLWWRLPLCVLAGALTDVAYKRLTHLEAGGGFVMGDLQAIEAAADVTPPAMVQAWPAEMGMGFAAGMLQAWFPGAGGLLPPLEEVPVPGAVAEAQQAPGWDDAAWQAAAHQEEPMEETGDELAAVGPLQQQQQPHDQQQQQQHFLWEQQQESLVPAVNDGDNAADDGDNYGAGAMLQPAPPPPPPPAAAAAAAAATPCEEPRPSFQVAPLTRVYGDVLRGLHFLQKLDVDVTALGKILRLTSRPLQQVCEMRLHMMGDVQLPPGGLPCMPQLTYLEFYLPERRSWGVRYNEDEDLSLWLHQQHVRKLVVHGTYHAGGFFAPGHLAQARCSMPQLTHLIFRHCLDLEGRHLRQVVGSGLCCRIDVVEGHNFEAPEQPSEPKLAGPDGAEENLAGPDSAADEPAGPDVAEDAPAGPDLDEDGVAGPDVAEEEPGPQSEPGMPLSESDSNLSAFVDLVSVRAKKAGQARCKDFQAVIAEAAAVGVHVKLLPAVDWYHWNRDLLNRDDV